MKLVMTLVVRDEADIVDAQLAYHLNAGVDFVLATDHGSRDGTTEILESYEREGYLRLFREQGEMRESDWRTRMARLAATEYGADWVINTDADAFWWPRAESLQEVLVAIPPRYTVVQGLVRLFVPRQGKATFPVRMTARQTVQVANRPSELLDSMLRPVHRASPGVVIRADGAIAGTRFVPLRAWYPFEVLRFPIRAGEQVEHQLDVVDDEMLAQGLADGSLALDRRLLEALESITRDGRSETDLQGFLLPDGGGGRLALRVPSVVDDAAYAVECSEVREVDLAGLAEHVAELEQRLAWLEEGLWPRVVRVLSRFSRRARGQSGS